MNNSIQYKVNEPNIIHEIIDGEAIIVNMDKGHYYSLQHSGAEIWACLVIGMSLEDMVKKLTNQFEAEQAALKSAVEVFIDELLREEMIIPGSGDGDGKYTLEDKSQTKAQGNNKPFELPVLEKYTDMEELLLLDPIHEVDQTGWPKMPSEPSE